MSDAYVIGVQKTDTLTGRSIKVLQVQIIAAPVSSTGYPCQYQGASYAVTAGKNFYLIGFFFSVYPGQIGQGAAAGDISIYSATNAAISAGLTNLYSFTIAASALFYYPPAAFIIPLLGQTVAQNLYIGFRNNVAANAGASATTLFIIGYEA